MPRQSAKLPIIPADPLCGTTTESDLDALEEAVAKLSERQALGAEAQRIAGIGIWRLDTASGTLSWSDEVFRIFGVSAETFTPTLQGILALVHPHDRQAVRESGTTSVGSGEPSDLEYRIVRPDGKIRILCERNRIVTRDEFGGRTILLGTVQDITTRREAEEAVATQMREMQAELIFLSRQNAMGTMAATLAHEINQPLTAISNYATGLRRIVGLENPTSPISEGLAEIETNALRAGKIIRGMRAMAARGEGHRSNWILKAF